MTRGSRAGDYRFLAAAFFRPPVLRPPVFRPEDFLPADVRDGTFPPFFLASDRPIAIACLRLFTLRPEPLFSVPRFRRRIALSTVCPAFLPYFAIDPPAKRPRTDLARTSGRFLHCNRDRV